MSKKDIILKLFYSIEWYDNGDGLTKIIGEPDFSSVGLYGFIENNSQFCDVIYAKRIIQKLGHRVLIGSVMHIYKDKAKL